MMELHHIRGGAKEELLRKHYNIGVGISLGSKWFTPKNIVGLVEWSLQHTRESVIVYVADSIHAINIEVRKRVSPERAMQMALEMGKEVLQNSQRAISHALPEESHRIHYATWKTLVDDQYRKNTAFLYDLYDNDPEFKETIRHIIADFLHREGRRFSDENIDKLATYILEEMPELINRVPINGIACDAYVYPYDGKVTELAEQIQQGSIFPKIKAAILQTDPKVFLEVR